LSGFVESGPVKKHHKNKAVKIVRGKQGLDEGRGKKIKHSAITSSFSLVSQEPIITVPTNESTATDYGCEDGRFPVSESCVTISNPNLLSSTEKGGQSWKKKLKKALDWLSPMSESHWRYLLSISQKK
jgi:hypothetical protein